MQQVYSSGCGTTLLCPTVNVSLSYSLLRSPGRAVWTTKLVQIRSQVVWLSAPSTIFFLPFSCIPKQINPGFRHLTDAKSTPNLSRSPSLPLTHSPSQVRPETAVGQFPSYCKFYLCLCRTRCSFCQPCLRIPICYLFFDDGKGNVHYKP